MRERDRRHRAEWLLPNVSCTTMLLPPLPVPDPHHYASWLAPSLTSLFARHRNNKHHKRILEEDDWENWIRLSMWDKVIEALIGATSYHVFSSASCHTHFGTRHCHIHYFVLYMVLYLFKYLFLIFLFKIKD